MRAWLFGIARRKCAARLAKRTRRRARLHLLPDPENDPGPAVPLARKRRAHLIRTALAELKPSHREAVVMRYQAGLEYSEIAMALDIDESAVRKRVSRALAGLRSRLAAEDLE